MALARYLADKSAYARLHRPRVYERLGPLLEHGLVATCSLIDLEVLYSCRSPEEYESVRQERSAWERLDIEQADWDRALAVQGLLARRSRHRAAGLADLVLAAVAERHRVVLLHYDRDFRQVAEVTGQPVEWVVQPGSVP